MRRPPKEHFTDRVFFNQGSRSLSPAPLQQKPESPRAVSTILYPSRIQQPDWDFGEKAYQSSPRSISQVQADELDCKFFEKCLPANAGPNSEATVNSRDFVQAFHRSCCVLLTRLRDDHVETRGSVSKRIGQLEEKFDRVIQAAEVISVAHDTDTREKMLQGKLSKFDDFLSSFTEMIERTLAQQIQNGMQDVNPHSIKLQNGFQNQLQSLNSDISKFVVLLEQVILSKKSIEELGGELREEITRIRSETGSANDDLCKKFGEEYDWTKRQLERLTKNVWRPHGAEDRFEIQFEDQGQGASSLVFRINDDDKFEVLDVTDTLLDVQPGDIIKGANGTQFPENNRDALRRQLQLLLRSDDSIRFEFTKQDTNKQVRKMSGKMSVVSLATSLKRSQSWHSEKEENKNDATKRQQSSEQVEAVSQFQPEVMGVLQDSAELARTKDIIQPAESIKGRITDEMSESHIEPREQMESLLKREMLSQSNQLGESIIKGIKDEMSGIQNIVESCLQKTQSQVDVFEDVMKMEKSRLDDMERSLREMLSQRSLDVGENFQTEFRIEMEKIHAAVARGDKDEAIKAIGAVEAAREQSEHRTSKMAYFICSSILDLDERINASRKKIRSTSEDDSYSLLGRLRCCSRSRRPMPIIDSVMPDPIDTPGEAIERGDAIERKVRSFNQNEESQITEFLTKVVEFCLLQQFEQSLPQKTK